MTETMGNSKITGSQTVFIVGFMGSGKTTWGKKLAEKTGRLFIDLDEYIVSSAGMPISEYFKEHGETAFRELESHTLKCLPSSQPAVVSTGGGTPCYFDNMAWMNEHGMTIYFHLPVKALWHRLMQTDITTRPALRGLSGEELLDHISAKLAEREPYYQQASYTVNQLSLQLEDLVRMIG